VGQYDRKRHQLLGLVSGITEHDTLVTSTNGFQGTVIKSLSNIRRLLFDGYEDVAGLVVKAFLRVIITNLLDGFTDDLLEVDLSLGGDLAKDHDHAGLGRGFAGNFGARVLSQASIELVDIIIMIRQVDIYRIKDSTYDSIGDLVTDFVYNEFEGNKRVSNMLTN
jgi:hypothetical protein